jgi:hypothetical protein
VLLAMVFMQAVQGIRPQHRHLKEILGVMEPAAAALTQAVAVGAVLVALDQTEVALVVTVAQDQSGLQDLVFIMRVAEVAGPDIQGRAAQAAQAAEEMPA